jgi:transmembrane sensor
MSHPAKLSPRQTHTLVAQTSAEIAATAAEWFTLRDAGPSREQEAAFQRWLAADPKHAAAYAQLDAAWASFGKPLRAGQADELLQELAARSQRRRQTRTKFAVAALAMVMVAGSLWRFSQQDELPARPETTATLLVPRQQTLSDGSVVTLNKGAEISVAFSADRRRVFLKQGEAHFQVAKNPNRPFLVQANGVEVRAVGTAFSVQCGDKAVAVLVNEGTVAVGKSGAPGVKDPAAPDAGRVAALPAALSAVTSGNCVVVGTSTDAPVPSVVPVNAVEMMERLAWLNPRVEFSGAPLADAVALINRESKPKSGVELIVGDPELGRVRVSGIFRTDNLDAFVRVLENGDFNIKAESSAGTIILRRAP